MSRSDERWPWATPTATRQGITDRLRTRYPPAELQLRRVEVAFRRLLVRLEASAPQRWIVKGGVALLLRLDPSRTSDDIDLSYVDAAGEHATAIRALERAFEIDAGDFFAFAFTTLVAAGLGETDADTFTVRVRARVGEIEWATFGVDLQAPSIDAPTETISNAGDLTGLGAVDDLPPLRALPISQQLAEKTCAMFERHGVTPSFSSRARDLVDIAMIASQVDKIDGTKLEEDLRREEARRLDRATLRASLPARFTLPDEQLTDWRGRWTKATRGVAITLDDAYRDSEAFLTAVLAGRAAGHHWLYNERRWG